MQKVTLKEITDLDISLLDYTEYKNLSEQNRRTLVKESNQGKHGGEYFKFYILEIDENAVGVMNLCGHGKDKISVAPEIFTEFRNKGFAALGLKKVYQMVKDLNFKTLVADIARQNQASVNLHLKLGFEIKDAYVSNRGREMLYLEKQL